MGTQRGSETVSQERRRFLSTAAVGIAGFAVVAGGAERQFEIEFRDRGLARLRV
jgi:hypothetical protein